eukprot:363000-Chlamydomonas_euryale.AAC.2
MYTLLGLLRRRVRLPLVYTPQGVQLGRPPLVRPPCGWSIGFIAMPRVLPRRPRLRFSPACGDAWDKGWRACRPTQRGPRGGGNEGMQRGWGGGKARVPGPAWTHGAPRRLPQVVQPHRWLLLDCTFTSVDTSAAKALNVGARARPATFERHPAAARVRATVPPDGQAAPE